MITQKPTGPWNRCLINGAVYDMGWFDDCLFAIGPLENHENTRREIYKLELLVSGPDITTYRATRRG